RLAGCVVIGVLPHRCRSQILCGERTPNKPIGIEGRKIDRRLSTDDPLRETPSHARRERKSGPVAPRRHPKPTHPPRRTDEEVPVRGHREEPPALLLRRYSDD